MTTHLAVTVIHRYRREVNMVDMLKPDEKLLAVNPLVKKLVFSLVGQETYDCVGRTAYLGVTHQPSIDRAFAEMLIRRTLADQELVFFKRADGDLMAIYQVDDLPHGSGDTAVDVLLDRLETHGWTEISDGLDVGQLDDREQGKIPPPGSEQPLPEDGGEVIAILDAFSASLLGYLNLLVTDAQLSDVRKLMNSAILAVSRVVNPVDVPVREEFGFRVGDKEFIAKDRGLVDTAYGPENLTEIWHNGVIHEEWQEPMTFEATVKEFIRDEEARQSRGGL